MVGLAKGWWGWLRVVELVKGWWGLSGAEGVRGGEGGDLRMGSEGWWCRGWDF